MLKVDGAYVAVKFPGTSSSMNNQTAAAPTDSDPSSLLQDCRLLRIDELQVWIIQYCLSSSQHLEFSVNVSVQVWASPPLTFIFMCCLCPSICSWQVVKTGGTPKVPDCFQRTPKKLCIPEKAEILAVNVDSKGESLLPYVSVYLIYFINTFV